MAIQKKDVIKVAKDIKHAPLSDIKTEYILRRYEDAQKDDPGATFDLVIEYLIGEADGFGEAEIKKHC